MEAHLRGIKKVIATFYLTILTLFLRIEGKEKFREKRLALRDLNAIVRYKLRMLTFFLRILNVHLTIQFFVSVIKKRQLLFLFSSIATFYLTILTFFYSNCEFLSHNSDFSSQNCEFISQLHVYISQFQIINSQLWINISQFWRFSLSLSLPILSSYRAIVREKVGIGRYKLRIVRGGVWFGT